MNAGSLAVSFLGVFLVACSQYKEIPLTPQPASMELSAPPTANTNLATTRWRYVGPITPETTVLDIGSPKNIQICVDNLKTTVFFEVATDQCDKQVVTTHPVATGCLAIGSVRKVTILQAKNSKIYAAGGTIRHIDFDSDQTQQPVDRSTIHQWSYDGRNRSDIYMDPKRSPRILRLCVNKGHFENGWGVNFKSIGHSCNPTATNAFAVTGVVNSRYGVPGACAIVEASQLWVEQDKNPAGPANGTYQFLR